MLNPRDYRKEIEAGRLHNSMSFSQRVWTLTSRIPAGRVTTYRELARELGTEAYRAVGYALNRNPYAPKVPCHRVVGSDGSLTGFFHGSGKGAAKMLQQEGVPMRGPRVDLRQAMHRF